MSDDTIIFLEMISSKNGNAMGILLRYIQRNGIFFERDDELYHLSFSVLKNLYIDAEQHMTLESVKDYIWANRKYINKSIKKIKKEYIEKILSYRKYQLE